MSVYYLSLLGDCPYLEAILIHSGSYSESFLGSLASLGSLAGSGGGLASGGSLAEDFTALLLVPLEVLLHLSHGHLIGGLGGLLAAGGGHSGCGLLAAGGGSLSGGLLRGLLLGGGGLGGSVLDDLLDALSHVATLGGLLCALLGRGLGSSLALALSTLDLGDASLGSLNGALALLLDEDVVDGEDGGVALLELEFTEVVAFA